MVTLLNGGLANGSIDKRELHIGDLPSGSTPNYKKRKVSAVRDFPPGCGPNATLVNREENGFVPVGDDNVGQEMENCGTDKSVVQLKSQSLVAISSAVCEKGDGSFVASATDGIPKGAEESKLDAQPLGLSLPIGSEKDAVDVGRDLSEAEALAFHKESTNVESLLRVDGMGEGREHVLLGTEYLVNGTISIDSAKALEPTESSASDSLRIEKENPPSLKDKFRRRRVSATRDFPPFCGPNAPTEIKDHPERFTSGGMDLVEVTNVKDVIDTESGPSGQTSYVDTGNGTSGVSLAANMEVIQISTENYGTEGLCEGELVEESKSKELFSDLRDESMSLSSKSSGDTQEFSGTEMVIWSQDDNIENGPVNTVREVMHGLMAKPYCPWRLEKSASPNSVPGSEGKVKMGTIGWRGRAKTVAKKSIIGGNLAKKKSFSARKIVDETPSDMIDTDNGECDAHHTDPVEPSALQIEASPSRPVHRTNFDVNLPPFVPKSSSSNDARSRVRETLRLFQLICRKILQGEESKSGPGIETHSERGTRRIDLQAAKIIKEKGKEVNVGKHIIGAVPGVEVGDEFQYRVELAIVGVHRLYQAGIDYIKRDKMPLATSIVASGAYADDMENADVLTYSGQGGNLVGKNKEPEDQKLERGNLALKNSISEGNPVRVIRGSKEIKASESSDARDKIGMTYVYDGLYTVERYYRELGKHGKMVFMFELRRIPGQPELAWKEVKLSKKYKKRQGVCVEDISGGKESFPVCAVNTIDDEKPPSFTYITKMMHPDWFCPIPPKGCDCTGRCSDSRKCSCAVKNGGEIPYTHNGAIVETKPLVYECGPSCKCPPSCYNRVSQRGPKIKLEIFKTEARGWGVRSMSFIPSGSFICEYIGELLEDKEAEQRTGNDEYLFDIGLKNNDSSKTEDKESTEVSEDGGYTIDALQYGNIGRFVNHSCSPNLYAQNVLYDHEDPRMPHVMLYAADNIPPLQELTYDYNYSVDQIRDSNGNIKVKDCYCGSAQCTGRMY